MLNYAVPVVRGRLLLIVQQFLRRVRERQEAIDCAAQRERKKKQVKKDGMCVIVKEKPKRSPQSIDPTGMLVDPIIFPPLKKIKRVNLRPRSMLFFPPEWEIKTFVKKYSSRNFTESRIEESPRWRS